jgi:ubiquinone/menaquinone biosynthesis C-methylase UbiE
VRADWDRTAVGWERFEAGFLYALAGVDPTLLRALDLRPGQRVLDVGCGTGDPAIAIAQFVLPRGSVTAIDLSPRMLAIARRRARLRGITNLRFRVADMARLPARARFDRVTSRFGLMFAEDLPGTLSRLRVALRPGGRAAFAVWGPAARNPMFAIRAEVARPFVTAAPEDPETTAHPLRLARPGRLASLMRAAGFRRVRTVGVRVPHLWGNLEEAEAMSLGVRGPLRKIYLDLGPADRARVRRRLTRAVARFRAGDVFRVPGYAWVASGLR